MASTFPAPSDHQAPPDSPAVTTLPETNAPRERMGGTSDPFRYPGIRSDSDMYTLGYRFHPWRNAKAIDDGPSIRAYMEDAARWTVDALAGPHAERWPLICGFLSGTGHNDHAHRAAAVARHP